MRKPAIFVGVAISLLVLSGCAATENDGSSGDGESFTIGLLLPDTNSPRYETKDKVYFEEKLAELCADCEVLYANANANPSTQREQAQSMITQGVDVLVLDPVDGDAAAGIVDSAKQKDIPVVAYDRIINSPDLSYVISNDYGAVGELQGQTMLDALNAAGVDPASGGILMINGSSTDPNAGTIKAGALSVLEPAGIQVLSETDTWDVAQAQQWASSQIPLFGDQIIGIYVANDGNGGAAIAALKAAGWTDEEIGALNITGLDATVQGIQNVLAGLQLMTTYNAFQTEAYTAAEVAFALASGETPEATEEINGIPAYLNPPKAVTIDTIGSTVIADEFWTVADICTADYADACAAAGLS